jgi:hypothetical protein
MSRSYNGSRLGIIAGGGMRKCTSPSRVLMRLKAKDPVGKYWS